MKYILFFVLGLSITLCSCQKFLEEEPTGSLTDESKISSSVGGEALAISAYRALASWTSGTGGWGSGFCTSLEGAGRGYIKTEPKDNGSGDDAFVGAAWDRWYQGVRDCNLGIKMIPTVTGLSESDKSKLLGEVRTLRAFYYFNLVRTFGDVVCNTTVLTDIEQAEQPRTSLKIIYDRIIVPDLEFAVNTSTLKDTRSTDGRVTKHVARAILADVYLTMAGYPYQEVTDTTTKWCLEGLWTMTEYPVNSASAKDFLQKAKVQLDFLYGKYPIGNFSDLNNPAMDNKNGAIFQIQYLSGVSNNGMPPLCLPEASKLSVYSDENGSFIPSATFVNSYNPADKRIQDRVYYFYNDTKSKFYDPNEGPAEKFPFVCLYKYYDYQAIKVTAASGLNYNLYRYADILLMLTEVNWILTQLGVAIPAADVIKGINEVRERALLPIYSISDISLLTIMSERAYELAFEGKALFDTHRTRKMLIDGNGQFAGIANFVGHRPAGYGYELTKRHLIQPIPTLELNNNRKCLQSFGWTPRQITQE